jgi:hypothetical protein
MPKSIIPPADGSALSEQIVPSTRRVTPSPVVARRNSAAPTYVTGAAAEVAACIARHARERGEADGLDPQRVHNLLFLCQGYSLAAHGGPLFTGRLLASAGGVSCPDAPAPYETPHADECPYEVRQAVADVWERFGGLTPPKLQMRIQGHARCVQEMAGGGPDLSADPEALEKAFHLAVKQGLI